MENELIVDEMKTIVDEQPKAAKTPKNEFFDSMNKLEDEGHPSRDCLNVLHDAWKHAD